jgi:hypothetical protein
LRLEKNAISSGFQESTTGYVAFGFYLEMIEEAKGHMASFIWGILQQSQQ